MTTVGRYDSVVGVTENQIKLITCLNDLCAQSETKCLKSTIEAPEKGVKYVQS